MDNLVKTGKWSDGDQWVQETAGASNVSEEVMTRSRMWLKHEKHERLSVSLLKFPLKKASLRRTAVGLNRTWIRQVGIYCHWTLKDLHTEILHKKHVAKTHELINKHSAYNCGAPPMPMPTRNRRNSSQT